MVYCEKNSQTGGGGQESSSGPQNYANFPRQIVKDEKLLIAEEYGGFYGRNAAPAAQ
jgi:hypothetical protein